MNGNPSALTGQLVLPDRVQAGTVRFGRLISGIEPGPAAEDRFIVPGFIDVHVHGGGGGDTMDGAGGVRTLAAFHLRHGTTTILPTTITNPWERVLAALHGVAEVKASGGTDLPDIPGAHLEGPFISRQRLGAQPDFALEPLPGAVAEVLATGVVRLVTLAPELTHAATALESFRAAGVRVSLGHSTDDGSATRRLPAGPLGFTHLFNAMGGIEGRRPGLAGVALASSESFAELIFDLHHVHPDSMRAALNAKPHNLLFVTDAMRATGLGDGPTELGGQAVTVRDGRAELADGTLAGSVLTMDQALRNGAACGLTWPQLAVLTSGAAARWLGLDDRGELTVGRRADFVVLDGDLQVSEVWVAGERRH